MTQNCMEYTTGCRYVAIAPLDNDFTCIILYYLYDSLLKCPSNCSGFCMSPPHLAGKLKIPNVCIVFSKMFLANEVITKLAVSFKILF